MAERDGQREYRMAGAVGMADGYRANKERTAAVAALINI